MKKTKTQEDQQPLHEKSCTKEVVECSVCWGTGLIEIDNLGNDEDCTWCDGTGLITKIRI